MGGSNPPHHIPRRGLLLDYFLAEAVLSEMRNNMLRLLAGQSRALSHWIGHAALVSLMRGAFGRLNSRVQAFLPSDCSRRRSFLFSSSPSGAAFGPRGSE